MTTSASEIPIQEKKQTKEIRIALIGNPNTGKTTLFNSLTGMNQKVGNYPGVTVERKCGRFSIGENKIELIDLPGSYSLAARSPDEMVVNDVLLGKQQGEPPVDMVLAIVDASNLTRNLYFLSQILELGLPVVVALNMIDIAQGRGVSIDTEGLSKTLNAPVVPICAHRREGVNELRQAIEKQINCQEAPQFNAPAMPETFMTAFKNLQQWLQLQPDRELPHPIELQRAMIDVEAYSENRLIERFGGDFAVQLKLAREEAGNGMPLGAVETKIRYEWASHVLSPHLARPDQPVVTLSHRLDRVLTHKLWGSIVFFFIMALVFQSIYSWAGPFMDIIEGAIGFLGEVFGSRIPEGALRSLVQDGIIAGVGSVVIFVPQIAILFFFLAILEDCGYLPRAAYLMDRLLSKFGLSGKSFIPLLSSFACAVPGVMATRTIEDRRDRLVTILVAPLMSCSARLPVYLIFIAAFVPDRALFGSFFNLQGLTLFGMYLVGIVAAIPVALIANRWLLRKEPSAFVLEMPTYKLPSVRNVLFYVYERSAAFLYRAGTIIFACTILVWALAYFPQSTEVKQEYASQREQAETRAAVQLRPLLAAYDAETYGDDYINTDDLLAALEEDARFAMTEDDAPENAVPAYDTRLEEMQTIYQGYQKSLERLEWQESGAMVRASALGWMGRAIEPLVEPLGWDWRIGMATLASFPAREVIVSTLGTIFNLGGGADEASEDLLTTIQNAKKPDGSNLFNIAVALSVMVFFALCSQCVSTLAVIKRETNSWSWPIATFVYMTVLAYIASFVTYQAAVLIGLG
ncbi:MAG: ferrous iron transport protein B [Candidatus Hinthialibacter antarcticus]|nr:ferrous iron transport protein B [Candidatus Hinthialibacter antarcticus]